MDTGMTKEMACFAMTFVGFVFAVLCWMQTQRIDKMK